MKYIVIELQVQDGTVANLVTAHDNLQQARAKYHAILSAAAVSGLDSHAAVLMEENGAVVARECYATEE